MLSAAHKLACLNPVLTFSYLHFLTKNRLGFRRCPAGTRRRLGPAYGAANIYIGKPTFTRVHGPDIKGKLIYGQANSMLSATHKLACPKISLPKSGPDIFLPPFSYQESARASGMPCRNSAPRSGLRRCQHLCWQANLYSRAWIGRWRQTNLGAS